MPAPDFARWGIGLVGDDAAAAIGAAGVIWAQGLHPYPFPSDPAWLTRALRKSLSSSGTLLLWDEPYFLAPSERSQKLVKALATAWKRLRAEEVSGQRIAIRRYDPK